MTREAAGALGLGALRRCGRRRHHDLDAADFDGGASEGGRFGRRRQGLEGLRVVCCRNRRGSRRARLDNGSSPGECPPGVSGWSARGGGAWAEVASVAALFAADPVGMSSGEGVWVASGAGRCSHSAVGSAVEPCTVPGIAAHSIRVGAMCGGDGADGGRPGRQRLPVGASGRDFGWGDGGIRLQAPPCVRRHGALPADAKRDRAGTAANCRPAAADGPAPRTSSDWRKPLMRPPPVDQRRGSRDGACRRGRGCRAPASDRRARDGAHRGGCRVRPSARRGGWSPRR